MGEAIREYLVTMDGKGYPYGFYKLFRQTKKRTSYAAVRRYFWVLKEIGLIKSVGFAADKTPFRKHYYAVVPAKLEDPAWYHPQMELYPDTGLGKIGYKKLADRGLKPKGGRRKRYVA